MSEHLEERDDAPGFYDAGDEGQVRKVRRDARRDARRHDAVLRGLMDLPEGRAWLWQLLGFTSLYETPFRANALEMARLCGKGDVGRFLLSEITRVAPDQYLIMIREHQK